MEKVTNYVMDYETMINLFVAVFIDWKCEDKKVFVIHELRNDYPEFVQFLKHNKEHKEWHISFNGLAFDSQITEYILINHKKLDKLPVNQIISAIYDKAQSTIRKSNAKEFLDYPEWKLSIQQIDVFKINHWDNANKRTSLKWAEFSMDSPNVQDMPIHHNTPVNTIEEINMIIDYCANDVKATKEILHLSKPLIDVRNRIKKKYGLNCYNFSNTKLGSELLLKLYCDATGRQPYEVKPLRTRRDGIPVKDILFPYIEFKSMDFQGFHELLKTKIITNTKSDFQYTMNFNGYIFDYGAGGIHQCIETGIYKSGNSIIIKDLDVASLYPSIACMNGMYPAHLGSEFFTVYKHDIVDVRLAEKSKPKQDRDMAIIEGFKEAANATYGNSNSEYSWLFDPQYTMQTTINGQLLITMLVEELLLTIPGSKLLQTNTDGATLMFDEKYLDVYNSICKSWEEKTKLTLEFADYDAMYIWDVNNYIAVYTDGKTKCKGRFEWEDLQKHKYTHLHKNKSFLIVAKAIYAFFVHNTLPEQFLQENRNIYDYCGGVKIKGNWEFQQVCVDKEGIHRKVLQNTLRYYISNKGCKMYKVNKSDKREIQVEAGKWMQELFNTYENKEWKDYDINDSYYLKKIYNEINNIIPKKKTTIKFI
jgi:hypothetical protein